MAEKVEKKETYTFATIKRLVGELRPVAFKMTVICIVSLISVALNMVGPDILGQISDILYNYGQGRCNRQRYVFKTVRQSCAGVSVYCRYFHIDSGAYHKRHV